MFCSISLKSLNLSPLQLLQWNSIKENRANQCTAKSIKSREKKSDKRQKILRFFIDHATCNPKKINYLSS